MITKFFLKGSSYGHNILLVALFNKFPNCTKPKGN